MNMLFLANYLGNKVIFFFMNYVLFLIQFMDFDKVYYFLNKIKRNVYDILEGIGYCYSMQRWKMRSFLFLIKMLNIV